MPSSPYPKSQRHAEVGRRLLRQAQEDLDQGDLIQAAEKVWGASSHAVKSVAEKWGWHHQSHYRLRAAVSYIAQERGRSDLQLWFGYLENQHQNYYEVEWDADEIQVGLNVAQTFTEAMAQIRAEAVPNFPAPDELPNPQRRRLRMLTTPPQQRDISLDDSEFLPPVEPERGVEWPPDSE